MKDKQTMADEFAREHRYTGAVYLQEWRGFSLFAADDDSYVGLPQYILVSENSVRFASSEETESIILK